ncbi:helix-turn-helix domain-containing protein [Millisia brevis]|uniref:helix-turn-helix domain-containing protein n=1 Tax=Millisia brevis TaxID=264148 RepID=UPI0009FE5654|nr:helix-turn-helix transcriptional regulator [Millisia brevis]
MSDVVPFRPRGRSQSSAESARPTDAAAGDRASRPDADRVPLWREAVGREMRRERQDRRERISDIADRAGISPQYLSELERGRKDPSSEVMEAVAGALGLRTVDLARRAASRLDRVVHAAPTLRPGTSTPTCLAA